LSDEPYLPWTASSLFQPLIYWPTAFEINSSSLPCAYVELAVEVRA